MKRIPCLREATECDAVTMARQTVQTEVAEWSNLPVPARHPWPGRDQGESRCLRAAMRCSVRAESAATNLNERACTLECNCAVGASGAGILPLPLPLQVEVTRMPECTAIHACCLREYASMIQKIGEYCAASDGSVLSQSVSHWLSVTDSASVELTNLRAQI